ncbi:MAG: 4Fe-4S binding protein [Candidatus Helarchaeota archaeon]
MDIYFEFDSEKIYEPVLANIIIETQIPINIVKVTVSNEGGEALITVPDEVADKIIARLRQKGLKPTSKFRKINLDKELCVDCGHCVSLCSFNALAMDENMEVMLDSEKCTGCRRCLDACPRNAISI